VGRAGPSDQRFCHHHQPTIIGAAFCLSSWISLSLRRSSNPPRGSNNDGDSAHQVVPRSPILLSHRDASCRLPSAARSPPVAGSAKPACTRRPASGKTTARQPPRRQCWPAAAWRPATRRSTVCPATAKQWPGRRQSGQTATHQPPATATRPAPARTTQSRPRSTDARAEPIPAQSRQPPTIPRPSRPRTSAAVGPSTPEPPLLPVPAHGSRSPARLLRSPYARHQPCQPPEVYRWRLLPL
jgi:hypothetical protein